MKKIVNAPLKLWHLLVFSVLLVFGGAAYYDGISQFGNIKLVDTGSQMKIVMNDSTRAIFDYNGSVIFGPAAAYGPVNVDLLYAANNVFVDVSESPVGYGLYVGNTTGDGNAYISGNLEIKSGSGLVKLPKLTTAERDALTPAEGDFIYNTTEDALQYYTGSSWKQVSAL